MMKLTGSGSRGRLALAATTAVLSVSVLAGCGSGDSDAAGSGDSSGAAASGLSEVQAVADLVPQSVKDRGTLRVAVPDGSAPLASKTDSGAIEGMDPDFANALAAVMGLKVQLTAGSFDSQIPGLQSGKFDLAMGEYYVTAERLASVDFVSDWRDYSSFATRSDDDWAPKTGQELCGHAVGVMKGSAEEASVTDLNKQCSDAMDISSFPDQAASFLALNSKRIDAVVTGRGPLEAASKQSDAFKISGEYGGGPCATAVARNEDSEAMLKAVQAGFEELVSDGTYAKILKKWDTDYGALEGDPVIYTEDSTPPDYS